jgi:hypothetical protein
MTTAQPPATLASGDIADHMAAGDAVDEVTDMEHPSPYEAAYDYLTVNWLNASNGLIIERWLVGR